MATPHFTPRAPGKLGFLALLACLLAPLATDPSAQACTLYAAAGGRVEGGGTIILKNRDRTPRQSALRIFTPREGYKHLALVAVGNPQNPAVAGINEKGLVVMDASPSCLANEEEVCGAVALTQALLTRCASVDEVLAQKDLLGASYPVFEMAADRRKVAMIEIAPRGQVGIKVCANGTLYHTNHYLDPLLLWANQNAYDSSGIRYRRIEQLLSRQKVAFTLEDFLALSQDRHDGPDHSINRTGSTPSKIRTLATFVVRLSDGAPQVFVRMTNPGEPDKIINIRLEPALWQKALREKIL